MKKQKMTAATTIAFGLITVTLINTTSYTAVVVTEPDAKAISLVRAAFKLLNPTNPKTARIHAEGNMLLNNQGLNPQQSTRTQRLSADWRVDFQNRRFLQRSATHLGKDLMWCTEIGTTREMRYQLFCHSNVFANYGPPQSDGSWTFRMDTTYPDPQWHLAHVLERSQSLHWEGESVFDGQREDVISYSDEFNNHHRLFLNSTTHLLREVSTAAQLTRFGEGFVPRIVFENYRRNGRYWNPAKVTIVQNSWTIITSDLQSIRRDFDRTLSAADFAPAPGAIEVDQKSFDFHVSKVAPSVYFVENVSPDYNSMFVVFIDYVLVVEAPSSDSDSTKVMAAIHEIAPGKPIRYIVPTHFHEDHIGGLRAYLREGATVVTTPGNLRFMEMFTKRLKATEPQIKFPPVEVIADKRRFSDGMVTLDLLNVPSPHVDEMVVPFLPSDGIVYVADGLTRDFGPWRSPTIDERTLVRHFKQLGLDIRTVLPGHGPAATQRDVERYWRLFAEPLGSISKRPSKRTAARTLSAR
jgi:glyoxylase-like metal-dependent hydrolase (beta-lactamase superfamily II)